MRKKMFLSIGLVIFFILFASFFIHITYWSASGVITTPLLGLLIFHSPILLIIYLLICVSLVFYGLKGKIRLI